jgi:tetratricopeptide (TPR) repeat protein
MGATADAAADFDAAVALEPTSAAFVRNRGLCHRACGELDAAVACFTRALQLAPGDAATLASRGWAGRRRAAYHSLLLSPDQLVSAAPKWLCRHCRRYAYRKLCDFGRALQDYERALAAGGLSAVQLHTNRAYCLAKLGRFAEALESYDLVLRANPANIHALHNRCASCEPAC